MRTPAGKREDWTRRNLRRVEGLRDRHRGAQCVILCSGPSLLEVDLELLAGHPFVMGVNGTYLLTNRFWSYFASNPEFVSGNVRRISEVDAEHVFVRWSMLSLCLEAGIPEERLILFEGDLDGISVEISTDIRRRLPWGPTVLLSIALPAAVWCGFEQILLLGADFPRKGYRRFFQPTAEAPRYRRKPLAHYETETEIARYRASLFAAHVRRHHPTVRVINCSPGSELEAFERGSLTDLLDPEGRCRG